jgi:hypothetical protein
LSATSLVIPEDAVEPSEDGAGDVDFDESLELPKLRLRLTLGCGASDMSSGPAAAPRSAMIACSGGTCQVAFWKAKVFSEAANDRNLVARNVTYYNLPKSTLAQNLMNFIVLFLNKARRLRQDDLFQ